MIYTTRQLILFVTGAGRGIGTESPQAVCLFERGTKLYYCKPAGDLQCIARPCW